MSTLPFQMNKIVNLFLTNTVVVYRYTESYEKGMPVKSTQRLKCKAAVQPMKGEYLNRPPQADDDDEWLSVWSPFRFLLRDELLFRGNHYQVEKLEEWQENGGYTRVSCKRLHKTEVGPDWISMAGIADSSSIGIPTFSASDNITMNGIADTSAIGTPESFAITNRYVDMNGIGDTSSVGTPDKVEIDWMQGLILGWDFDDSSNFGGGSI